MRPLRILETAVYCADVVVAASFYERLGLVPMFKRDRFVTMDAGQGTVLLLFLRGSTTEGLRTAGGEVPGHDGTGPVHLAFAIESAEQPAWEARLNALGIVVESRVRWPRGGTSLYFRDPDGHSIEIATRGTWPNF